MTAERATCPVTRDRLHPGLLITGCRGEVLETATKCPLCGKPVESDPFKRLEDEYDALEATYRRLHARYCEIVTEVHRLRDFKEAVEGLWQGGSLHVMPASTLNRMEKQLERRKREVQTLQEACRKHREARRAYWKRGEEMTRATARMYGEIIESKTQALDRLGEELAGKTRLADMYEREYELLCAEHGAFASAPGAVRKALGAEPETTTLIVRVAWRPAPPGVMGAYLECSECGGPFEWAGFAVPTYCPHCGRKVENAWRRLNELRGETSEDEAK